MKKILSIVLVLVMTSTIMVGCGGKGSGKTDESNNLKVGVVLIGDKKDTYTKAHLDGIKSAAKEVGINPKNILVRDNIKENTCAKMAKDLIGNGCSLIISNSYAHQDAINKVAKDNSDVDFVAMSGDYAAVSGNGNMHNAFTLAYEARYVSGVVAGMKIKELVDKKKIPSKDLDKEENVKVGYVGAYPNAEIVSGYTAFYLGIKSVYKKVAMKVLYTNSWFNTKREETAAKELIKDNCLIIGMHTDSKQVPSVIQKAKDNGTKVYSVGYNESMLGVAKNAALTSSINNWEVYYKELFQIALDEDDIPRDWAKGYSDKAVSISKLGPEVAKKKKKKVKEVEKGLADGSIKVFDTSKFTVNGKKIESHMVDLSKFDYSKNPPTVLFKGEEKEAIETQDEISYFSESTLRSAPYFDLRIDGIKELNTKK